MPLYDNHGRELNYLRLSLTDKCNLRCNYCLPEHAKFAPAKNLLSDEEIFFLCEILFALGINKVRITGGEPFLRQGIGKMLTKLREMLPEGNINITTNGLLTTKYVPLMKSLNIRNVNLSLDALSPEVFFRITRRNDFDKVWNCLQILLENGFHVKVNAVVMSGLNESEILPLAKLAENYPLAVRYIEEMPFNGKGIIAEGGFISYRQIIEKLKTAYPSMKQLPAEKASTSLNFSDDALKGSLGVIPAYSRTFCGTCNRIRITAEGTLKTCLYDQGVLDLKKMLREKKLKNEITDALLNAFSQRKKDGFEAEKSRSESVTESMSLIGG